MSKYSGSSSKKVHLPQLEQLFINYVKKNNIDFEIDVKHEKFQDTLTKVTTGKKYAEIDVVGRYKNIIIFFELDEYAHSNHPNPHIHDNKKYSFQGSIIRQKEIQKYYQEQ